MSKQLTDLADVLWPKPGDKATVQQQSALLNKAVEEGVAQIIEATSNLEKPIPKEILVLLAGQIAILVARRDGQVFFHRLQAVLLAKNEQIRCAVVVEAPERRHRRLGQIVASLVGELVSLRSFARRGNRDIEVLTSHGAPEAERAAAAKRIASASFKSPIPTERWNAHTIEIARAVRERCYGDADNVRSRDTVLAEVAEEALIVAGLEAGQTHDAVYLEVDGQRRKVVCAPAGLIPKLALPKPYFDGWFRARVADEALGALVPDWRERERKRRIQQQLREQNRPAGEGDNYADQADPYDALEISLDELWAKAGIDAADSGREGPLDGLLAAENNRERLAEILEMASRQQGQLLHHMIELLEEGHPIHGAIAEVAGRMGIPADQARKQLQRMRERKKKKVRRKR